MAVIAMDNPEMAAWRMRVLELLDGATALRLDQYFLAGRSMHHLLFSTLERFGLEDEPRVTIATDDGYHLYVALTRFNIWSQPAADRASLEGDDALRIFVSYLQKLWLSTNGNQPLPIGVA